MEYDHNTRYLTVNVGVQTRYFLPEPVLNFLLSCMQHAKLSTMAANALQNICSTCRDQMGAHFQGLLQIIQAMDGFKISNDAAVGLLKGKA